MTSKRVTEAFFIILSIALVSFLSDSAFAEDCIPSSGKTCYQYDELNRLKRVDRPDGSYMKYDYDKLGNILTKEMWPCPTTTSTTNTDCTLCTGANQSCVEGQCTWIFDSWEAIEYYDCYECWDYDYECDDSGYPPVCWRYYLSCTTDRCTTTTAVCPPVCGNGTCESGETTSCPADCAACTPTTYGPWQWDGCWFDDPASCWTSWTDTCNGDVWNAYGCPSGTTKTCNDVADYYEDLDWEEWRYRTVNCGSCP